MKYKKKITNMKDFVAFWNKVKEEYLDFLNFFEDMFEIDNKEF